MLHPGSPLINSPSSQPPSCTCNGSPGGHTSPERLPQMPSNFIPLKRSKLRKSLEGHPRLSDPIRSHNISQHCQLFLTHRLAAQSQTLLAVRSRQCKCRAKGRILTCSIQLVKEENQTSLEFPYCYATVVKTSLKWAP